MRPEAPEMALSGLFFVSQTLCRSAATLRLCRETTICHTPSGENPEFNETSSRGAGSGRRIQHDEGDNQCANIFLAGAAALAIAAPAAATTDNSGYVGCRRRHPVPEGPEHHRQRRSSPASARRTSRKPVSATIDYKKGLDLDFSAVTTSACSAWKASLGTSMPSRRASSPTRRSLLRSMPEQERL